MSDSQPHSSSSQRTVEAPSTSMPTTANTAATPPLSSFLAGIAGGSASTIMLYPLDLIKVRMQVDEGPARRRVDVVVGDSIAAAVNNVGVGGSSGGKKSTICTTVRSVIRHEGYVGLYRGLMPAIIGSAASWGGFFIIYEDIKGRMMHRKRTMEQRQHHSSTIGVGEERRFDDNYMSVRLGPIEHFSSSCLAGACMVALTNPLWLIKTRLQLQNSRLLERQMMQQTQPHVGIVTMATNDASTTPSTTEQRRPRVKPPYRGLFHAAYTIAHEEGIMAFYKGSVPALMLVSHGGIQFMTYEFMKGHFSSYVGNGKRNDVERRSKGGTADGIQGKGTIRERLRDSLGYLVMGAMSKFVASTATYPLQVMKARLQQRSQSIEVSETTGEIIVTKREYSGVIDCTKKIWRNEGIYGFFKGCVTNALRVAPSAAVTFVTYEFVLDMLTEMS